MNISLFIRIGLEFFFVERLFIIRDEEASVAASDPENNWNTMIGIRDGKSFQELEPPEKGKKDIIRDVLRMIDRFLSKWNFDNEDDVRNLNKIVLGTDWNSVKV